MKYLLSVFVLVTFTMCSTEYSEILEGLSKNHVLLKDEMEDEMYFDYFKMDRKEYKENVQQYHQSISDFYNSEKDIIDYLQQYENDTTHLCNWIKTKNPYSSTVFKDDLITKSSGSLILIDNYLSNPDKNYIMQSKRAKNLSYGEFTKFYKRSRGLKKDELRKRYISSFVNK